MRCLGNSTWRLADGDSCTALPICFGRNTQLVLADGSTRTVEQLYAQQRVSKEPLGSVRDVRGRAHAIRRVVMDHSRDFSVVLPPDSLAPGVPAHALTLTASHLVLLPNGSVASAGELADALHLTRLVPRPGRLVFHVHLDEWVFISAHGLGCESAATTVQHMRARAAAHRYGIIPDPSCAGGLDLDLDVGVDVDVDVDEVASAQEVDGSNAGRT